MNNVQKLELGIDISCDCEKFIPKEKLTEKVEQELIDIGSLLEEVAMSSGEIAVLERAFEYFFEEENDIALANGGCESLEGDIFRYFSWEQIFSVLKKKFKKLVEFNKMRAEHFAATCDGECLKELMDTLPYLNAKKFLIEIKDFCREELAEEIDEILENMK